MGFCKVCTSPNRVAIEEALAAGESQRSVARRFGLGQGSVSWHTQKKHPPAESLEAIGDEPVIARNRRGSYDWIKRQARARGKRIEELLGETVGYDPFYLGSDGDVRNAKWFAEAVVRRFEVQIKAKEAAGGKPHLRGLHYLCVTAPPNRPVRWPSGRVYENTELEWNRLQRFSRIARWLGFANIEDFDDQRNAEPKYFAPSESEEEEPSVSADYWRDWELPTLDDASLDVDEWLIPNISAEGYECCRLAAQPLVQQALVIEEFNLAFNLRFGEVRLHELHTFCQQFVVLNPQPLVYIDNCAQQFQISCGTVPKFLRHPFDVSLMFG